jgi:hypothetical protein
MNELPPIVIGDPAIDAINAIAWSLSVPENGDAIQLLQRAVVALERTANKERKHANQD